MSSLFVLSPLFSYRLFHLWITLFRFNPIKISFYYSYPTNYFIFIVLFFFPVYFLSFILFICFLSLFSYIPLPFLYSLFLTLFFFCLLWFLLRYLFFFFFLPTYPLKSFYIKHILHVIQPIPTSFSFLFLFNLFLLFDFIIFF